MKKFKIGDKVKVVCGTDEEFNELFLNKEGEITNIDYRGYLDTDLDIDYQPFIEVVFPDNTKDGFWKEELEIL